MCASFILSLLGWLSLLTVLANAHHGQLWAAELLLEDWFVLGHVAYLAIFTAVFWSAVVIHLYNEG